MANRAINDLPRAEAVNDNDLFVLEQSGGSMALTGALLKSYAEDAAAEQAEAAAASAENAADSAQAAADVATYPPITKTGSDNWWTWDSTTEAYVDSGIPARGPQGDPGAGVPTVTTTDNGKVLMVVNGTWAAAETPEMNYETTTNKVTSLSASSTDTQYPSAKCVYDAIIGAIGGSY